MKKEYLVILFLIYTSCKSPYQKAENLIHTKIVSNNDQKNVYIYYNEIPGAIKLDNFSNYCFEFFLLRFWVGKNLGHSDCNIYSENRMKDYKIPENHLLIIHKINPLVKSNFFIDHFNNLWATFYSAYSPWPHLNYLLLEGEIASISKQDYSNYLNRKQNPSESSKK